MFKRLCKPENSPLVELSLKQREMLLAYRADAARLIAPTYLPGTPSKITPKSG